MNYTNRIQHLQRSLQARKIDAILVSQPENRRYLSGYTGGDHGIGESSGYLLIPKKGTSYLLTDFRYLEQAEKDTEDYEIQLYPRGLLALCKEMLPKLGIKRLAIESDYTLHSVACDFFKMGEEKSIEIIPTTDYITDFRLIKNDDEIELIRQSVHLNEEVFQEVYKGITGEETELDIALKIAATMRQKGAESESFSTIVAAGANASLPHAVPGNTPVQKDAMLLIDMGLIYKGYCSDMTRTFTLSAPDEKYLKLHRLVRKAQLAGINAIRAGVTGKEVDSAARKVIEEGGYGKYFGHGLGHGVGIAVHENPRLSQRSLKKLRSGMVVTVEPGIYIPGWGGIRLENMVVVREEGAENLNKDTTFLDI